MTTWNELPAHLVSKIRSDSVTAPANLPGAVPVLKYGNRVTEVDGIRFDSEKEAARLLPNASVKPLNLFMEI